MTGPAFDAAFQESIGLQSPVSAWCCVTAARKGSAHTALYLASGPSRLGSCLAASVAACQKHKSVRPRDHLLSSRETSTQQQYLRHDSLHLWGDGL